MKTEHRKQRKIIVFSVTTRLMHKLSMNMEHHQRSIKVWNMPASITTHHQLGSESHTACKSSASQEQSLSKLSRLRNYTNFTLEIANGTITMPSQNSTKKSTVKTDNAKTTDTLIPKPLKSRPVKSNKKQESGPALNETVEALKEEIDETLKEMDAVWEEIAIENKQLYTIQEWI